MENYLYAVEWSESQKCLHIKWLVNGVDQENLTEFLNKKHNRFNDWFVIAVFLKVDDAYKFIKILREKRNISNESKTYDRTPVQS